MYILIQDNLRISLILNTKDSLDFKMGLKETPGYVDNLPLAIILFKEGKIKWQHQTQK
jgi:hypothetical protein